MKKLKINSKVIIHGGLIPWSIGICSRYLEAARTHKIGMGRFVWNEETHIKFTNGVEGKITAIGERGREGQNIEVEIEGRRYEFDSRVVRAA